MCPSAPLRGPDDSLVLSRARFTADCSCLAQLAIEPRHGQRSGACRVEGPVSIRQAVRLQTLHAVMVKKRHRTPPTLDRMMMIIVLHTRHRAAQAGSMLKVDHMHGPVAAVQQSTMPGACQELGSITWPHTAYASA